MPNKGFKIDKFLSLRPQTSISTPDEDNVALGAKDNWAYLKRSDGTEIRLGNTSQWNERLVEGGLWSYGKSSGSVSQLTGGSAADVSAKAQTGQTFSATKSVLDKVHFFAFRQLGGEQGFLTAYLYATSAGTPFGAPLAVSNNTIDASLLNIGGSGDEIIFDFPPTTLTVGSTYAITVDGVTSGTITLVRTPGESFGSGNQIIKNAPTSSWSIAGADLKFQIDMYDPQLTWSDNAYIQIPGLIANRNRIAAGSAVIKSGQAAYVVINREVDLATTLSVTVADIGDVDPFNADLFILAQFTDGDLLVGSVKMGLGEKLDLRGRGRPGVASIENNQLFPRHVSGFVVDPTLYNGFEASYSLIRSNAGSVLDADFSTGAAAGFTGATLCVAYQADGKILVGGSFTAYKGNARAGLVRLNADGTDDTSFYTNLGTGFGAAVNAIAVQSDGKILVGGAFTTFNGNTRNRLARLNDDGSEDTSFYTNLGTGFGAQVRTIALQSDGKSLVGGDFTTLNGNSRGKIVRLGTDGTEDASFASASGTGATGGNVYKIVCQSDGTALAGGDFTTYDSVASATVARINSDGSVDTDFATEVGSGATGIVKGIALFPDNSAVLIGTFSGFNGVAAARIVKIFVNGAVDNDFVANYNANGFDDNPTDVAIQVDGKIVVVGTFTTFKSNSRGKIVRLNSDATEDSAFATAIGTGFNTGIQALAIDPNSGKIALAGSFTTFKAGACPDGGAVLWGPNEVKKQGSLKGIYSDAEQRWYLGEGLFIGDEDTGVEFSINDDGYLLYTSDNRSETLLGLASKAEMRFSLNKL